MKDVFLGRDLRAAFDLTERKLQYWMEQGFIKPDLNSKQPRVYSLAEAVICGLTTYFVENGGYYPAHAAKIARLTYNTFLMLTAYMPDENCPLEIYDNSVAHITVTDPNGYKHGYSFAIQDDVQYKPKSFENIKWNTKHSYKIFRIINYILKSLGWDGNAMKLSSTKDMTFLSDHVKEGNTENIWLRVKDIPQ